MVYDRSIARQLPSERSRSARRRGHGKGFRARPDLKPAYLDDRSQSPDADRRLTRALAAAYRAADSGDRRGAIRSLQLFASAETSQLHLEIVRHEIERLQGQPDAQLHVRPDHWLAFARCGPVNVGVESKKY